MDLEQYLRFVGAFILVLALIGLVAWVGRRFGLMPRAGNAQSGRRLQVVEVAPVDARRRLVLIRRDDVEHLLLLGQGADVVIESGVRTNVSRSREDAA
ncbi:MAG TPA: flagellar biosynthetic protein FliO [Candidatus Cybelea sp.]|nr:flagellar biosynthetic protein FliO [Candidatus Cybelea sp.]